MNIIVITFIIIVIYYLLTVHQESFLVVGYNNPTIPHYTIKNIFDEETKLLDKEFSENSADHSLFNTKLFTLFNNSITFPFTNQFQKLILEFLKNTPRTSKDKISLGDFNMIYYLDDTLGNRIFILNVNIQDNTTFTSRNVKVKLLVTNIKLFYDFKTSNYLLFDHNLLENNCSVLSIILDKNSYANFTIKGIDQLNDTHYSINNMMFLLDPFITSGNDMAITENMKTTFEKSLLDHQQIKPRKVLSTNSVGSN